MSPANTAWETADFRLSADAGTSHELAAGLAPRVYDRVCRNDFRSPGFCLVDVGDKVSSDEFRLLMLEFRRSLEFLHRARAGHDIAVHYAGRFDQQVATKPHRDAGPAESILVLGYEPSGVRSELWISDYARCAFDLGLTPAEFLDRHVTLFGRENLPSREGPERRSRHPEEVGELGAKGERLLQPYTWLAACAGPDCFQMAFINNSMAPYSAAVPAWQGVLHAVTIDRPNPEERRIINFLGLASVPVGTADTVSGRELAEFASTALPHRRGYGDFGLGAQTAIREV